MKSTLTQLFGEMGFEKRESEEKADQFIDNCYWRVMFDVFDELSEEDRGKLRIEMEKGMSDDEAMEVLEKHLIADDFQHRLIEVAEQEVGKLVGVVKK